MKLDLSNVTWRVAKKTRPLKAKAMVNLLVDRSIMAKFLVDTLEAKEPVSPNAMFCIGESNDAWQQTPAKLLAKYDVKDIDADGWLICFPKPENSVEFTEAWEDGHITGQWGEIVDGEHNVQFCSKRDIIARSRTDPTDVWVVRRRIWDNSYTEITNG